MINVLRVFTLAMFMASSSLMAADATRGQTLYQAQCAACHSVQFNGVGPRHAGVVGRAAGSLSDYMYSAALKSVKFTWSDKTLDQWLKNPEAMVPGQKMGYSVMDETDRADLIEYLKSISKSH